MKIGINRTDGNGAPKALCVVRDVVFPCEGVYVRYGDDAEATKISLAFSVCD